MALHELRSPLGLVATAARSAADDCDDDVLRSRCEVIVRAAERMLRTAQTVLSLAQSAALMKQATFDPAASVRAIVTDLTAIGVQMQLLDETCAEEYAFEGVREQFETLVTSLLSNALDHAEPGTTVEVRLASSGDQFAAQISNVLAERSRHAGLGVGNYIADQLAEMIPATVKRTTDCGRYAVEIVLSAVGTTLFLTSAGTAPAALPA